MSSALSVLDFAVVLLVVMSVLRAVSKGPSAGSGSALLSVLLALALMIFGMVSIMAASGLTDNSDFNQGALVIFLVATAITAGMSWMAKSA